MHDPAAEAETGAEAKRGATRRSRLGRLEQPVDLALLLLAKEFKIRYKSTLLGYAWSVLHPLAMMAVFFVVFAKVMRLETSNPYLLVLATALFVWHWFSNAVGSSPQYFVGAASLIKKNRVPKLLFIATGVGNEFIHFLAAVPVVLLIMAFYGHWPHVSWLWLGPLLCAITFAMAFGLATALATVNLYFRDLDRLVSLGLMLWFYLTPAMLPYEVFKRADLEWIVWINPIGLLIEAWRRMFLEGAFPPVFALIAGAWALAAVGLGVAVYWPLRWRLAEFV